jgi:hypothetical protein
MLTNENNEIVDAINTITAKVSDVLLKEFKKLPADQQRAVILIKSSQLLLANVLCQIAHNQAELTDIVAEQGPEIQELVSECAMSAFADKFVLNKH